MLFRSYPSMHLQTGPSTLSLSSSTHCALGSEHTQSVSLSSGVSATQTTWSSSSSLSLYPSMHLQTGPSTLSLSSSTHCALGSTHLHDGTSEAKSKIRLDHMFSTRFSSILKDKVITLMHLTHVKAYLLMVCVYCVYCYFENKQLSPRV